MTIKEIIRDKYRITGVLGKGGVAITYSAIDLDSNIDVAIDKTLCFAAEVGLAGEVRPVTRIDQRVLEAQKLGFESIVISTHCKLPKRDYGIQIIKVTKVADVVRHLFA